jgi:hypothetical protein
MRCAFCDNEADDREGAPLCSACWDRIEERVRTEPMGVADSDFLLLRRLALMALEGALVQSISDLARPAGMKLH